MSEGEFSFEHGAAFEQGEVAGNLRLGKFEAQYSALFSEVLADGIITPEERAELDRTADQLGLDKDRIKNLEQALEAVWEARYKTRIVDLSGAREGSERMEDAPASLTPIAPATDPRTLALERRVHVLVARIKELEAELEEARSNVAVEVDLSGIRAAAPVEEEDPAVLQRRLAHDPRDEVTLRSLFQIYSGRDDVDRALCIARALDFVGSSEPAAKALLASRRQQALIQPKTSLTQESWRRTLFHPDEEVLTGEIFATIVSPVLLGRVAALRRDNLLPTLDPARRQDPATSTLQAVRCFSWAASILGMHAPALYADPDFAGAVEMVPGMPPATRLGKKALSGRTAAELAFIAGRHLAWYREERFLRLLAPSIQDLEDIFLAALVIGNPGIPLRPDTKKRVGPLAKAIEPILESIHVDRLRGYFLRFVEEGGRTNLQRWATAADRTACRAGLLLSDDLRAASAMLDAEDPAAAGERMDDLIVFSASDRYANLRKQLGIAVSG